MSQPVSQSSRQKHHFESVHDAYERHYYDATAMRYRKRYLYDVLLGGLDLNGMDVADLACGSGHNSLVIQDRFPGARLMGFDISAKACDDYCRNVGAEAREADLTQPVEFERQFDFALIVGGLHHCVADLPGAFVTINRLLKPGGRLAMYEPNRRFVLQAVRDLWYRYDKNFDHATEAALDHDEILEMAGSSYEAEFVKHFGGPAFYLIFNSMITRVPISVKPVIAPPLMVCEAVYNALPGRLAFPAFVARWQKRSSTE